jgi:hypothetical protein
MGYALTVATRTRIPLAEPFRGNLTVAAERLFRRDSPAPPRRLHRPTGGFSSAPAFLCQCWQPIPAPPAIHRRSIETERQNRRLAYVTRWLVDAA